MNHRLAVVALLVTLLSGSFAAPPLPRIGYAVFDSIGEPPSRERKAFLDALAELGWIDGQSVEIVYRSAQNVPEFLRPICEELLREKVDVLTTVGELATLACLNTTQSVPIVCLACGDPVAAGASGSLARPERNATGVSVLMAELAPKRIELLKLAVPAASGVALLWDESSPVAALEVKSARAAARRIGMQTFSMPVQSQAGLEQRFQEIARVRPSALYVSVAPGVIVANRTAIAQFALEHRLAVISGWAFMTEAGGLLSYAPDMPVVFGRGAYYVDRILRGTRPNELPIEQPTKIDLVINVSTARRLGLTLSRELLLRANRLIQ